MLSCRDTAERRRTDEHLAGTAGRGEAATPTSCDVGEVSGGAGSWGGSLAKEAKIRTDVSLVHHYLKMVDEGFLF